MIWNTAQIFLATATPPPGGGSNPATPWYFNNAILLVFFVLIMYLVLIRPQQKKAKEHANLIKNLRNGDKVVTSSGIIGTVVGIKEKSVSIRSADTKLEILKSAVSEIAERANEPSQS